MNIKIERKVREARTKMEKALSEYLDVGVWVKEPVRKLEVLIRKDGTFEGTIVSTSNA